MPVRPSLHRLPSLRGAVALCFLVTVLLPIPTYAQIDDGTETTFMLRPHCISGYEAENASDPGSDPFGSCPRFGVQDPQTLETPPLQPGDFLDIDVVVFNPKNLPISRVRSWLSYDPTVLRGDTLDILDPLPMETPGEATFDTENGYVMIEATAEPSDVPSSRWIAVARVQFTVLATVPAGSIISFYDVQSGGHTVIASETAGDDVSILEREPGVLHVQFSTGTTSSAQSVGSAGISASSVGSTVNSASSAHSTFPLSSSAEYSSEISLATGTRTEGEECTASAQCVSARCVAGVCAAVQQTGQNGTACTGNEQCGSGLCADGVCVAALDTTSSAAAQSAQSEAPRTAYGLLQVRNVRITTEATSVFVAWEALASSQLQGYNVYYGTTPGRYIQRKTVDGSTTSLALRGLPEGTPYYFAVRGVSTANEESAFSTEVSVTVGSPTTSTAPLSAGALNAGEGPAGQSPIAGNALGTGEMPGETGPASMFVLLALCAAGIGTALATRRQMIVQHMQ